MVTCSEAPATSHIRMVLSSEAVASSVPSGENATARAAPGVAWQGSPGLGGGA